MEQPLLVVDGTQDALLPPGYAQEIYDLAPEPKELVWIERHNHVELYDQARYVPHALDAIVPWLDEHLGR